MAKRLCQRCQKNEQPMLHTWTRFPAGGDASLWLLCDACDSTALALLEGRPVLQQRISCGGVADLIREIGPLRPPICGRCVGAGWEDSPEAAENPALRVPCKACNGSGYDHELGDVKT